MRLNICLFDSFVPALVAGAIADINQKVAKGDSKNTLQALQLPSAGLRAVHPECADTYQTKLAQSQANDTNKGHLNYCWNICFFRSEVFHLV